MDKLLKMIVCLIAVVISGGLYAGSQTGTVTDIRVSGTSVPGGSNPTHFTLSGTWSNQPSCAAINMWAIDTETEQGQSMLSILMMAYVTGNPVTVWGNGQCNLRSDMEDAFQIGVAQ